MNKKEHIKKLFNVYEKVYAEDKNTMINNLQYYNDDISLELKDDEYKLKIIFKLEREENENINK